MIKTKKNIKNVIAFLVGFSVLILVGLYLFSGDKTSIANFNLAIDNIVKSSNKNILICAHRAFHENAPENSLKSIQDAIDANVDIAEVDVRMTKDEVLVLMHDDKIDRTTTGRGYIKDYTFKELQQFNLKVKDSITSHKIPRLSEILKLAKGKIILNLDLKEIIPLDYYDLLKENKMEDEVISFIWNKKTLNEIIEIDSLYAVLPLSENKDEMESNYKSYYSPIQHFTEKSYTQENMNWAHKNGVKVFVNSLWKQDVDLINGNTKSLDSLLLLKPAIIQTDYPKQMLNYLKEKGLHD
ncbi:glycerophosphodiester phosphodiesterase family protein [Litoribaculum gwangyangense]|uniref:GP-PDE domain-containing protein n=1 Tax=Litoribaculum gwangyangense TaxID=1130722 RepID=A0ABP9CNZ7_9FLAO